MKCSPRCGSGGGDTGATQAQVGSAECCSISPGDIVVWFEGQRCLCNSNTLQSQTASVDRSRAVDLPLYLHP